MLFEDDLFCKILSNPNLKNYQLVSVESFQSFRGIGQAELIVQQIPRMDLVHAKELVKKWTEEVSDESLEIGSIIISLKCPLTQSKMKLPSRTVFCQHSQCFDLEGFVQFNLKKNQNEWRCPLCDLAASPKDLYIDSFLLSILENGGGLDCSKIEIKSDCSWKVLNSTPSNKFASSQEVVDLTENDIPITNRVSLPIPSTSTSFLQPKQQKNIIDLL